jgi:hypothetical protein
MESIDDDVLSSMTSDSLRDNGVATTKMMQNDEKIIRRHGMSVD